MGYSGLIYAVIVAAWAAVLVPRWVRRHEDVERARETDTARGVRVLQRRRPQYSRRPAVASRPATPSAPVTGRTATPPAGGRVDVRESRRLSTAVVMRRRRVLLALVVLGVATVAGSATMSLPGWAPLVPGAAIVVYLVMCRRSVAAGTVRPRRSRPGPQVRVEGRGVSARARPRPRSHSEGALRRLVIPDELLQPADDSDAWDPVPVPLPMYMTKPMAPRSTRSLDLGAPGAWTSGRLDPVRPIALVRSEPAPPEPAPVTEPTSTTDLPEQRRAVGD